MATAEKEGCNVKVDGKTAARPRGFEKNGKDLFKEHWGTLKEFYSDNEIMKSKFRRKKKSLWPEKSLWPNAVDTENE